MNTQVTIEERQIITALIASYIMAMNEYGLTDEESDNIVARARELFPGFLNISADRASKIPGDR